MKLSVNVMLGGREVEADSKGRIKKDDNHAEAKLEER